MSIEEGAIRGSRRSNPATYTGLLDPIRTAFAMANGVKPALFSANSQGACPNCNGAGVIYTDRRLHSPRRRRLLRRVRTAQPPTPPRRPSTNRLYGHIKVKQGRTEFLAFLRYVRSLRPPGVRIAVVLDTLHRLAQPARAGPNAA